MEEDLADGSLFDDSLFDGNEADGITNARLDHTSSLNDGLEDDEGEDAFTSQVLANISQQPSPTICNKRDSPIPLPEEKPTSEAPDSKRRRLSQSLSSANVSPFESPQPTQASDHLRPTGDSGTSTYDYNPFQDFVRPDGLLLWDEPAAAASDIKHSERTEVSKYYEIDKDVAELSFGLESDDEALFEGDDTDVGQKEWIPPPRSPDTPCNRLSKQRLEDMFHEEVDLRQMACHNLETEDEEPVCCACLLDLFPDDLDEVEDMIEKESQSQVPEEPLPPVIPTDPAAKQAFRAQRRRHVVSAPKPAHELTPRVGEDIGLLSSCLHIFHAECISKWAKTENACCQCKQRFGALAFYSTRGSRKRIIMIKKTLQSHRLREMEESEMGEENGDTPSRCQVCQQVGDVESLMQCAQEDCDSMAHWYCFDFECHQPGWKCRDCLLMNQPSRVAARDIPQPSRRRREDEEVAARARRAMRAATAKRRAAEIRAQRTQARLHQALNEIRFDDLQAPVTPVPRLLPSELETNQSRKSKVDDLILGTVSLRELGGRAASNRSQRASTSVPGHTNSQSVRKQQSAILLQPLASKPGAKIIHTPPPSEKRSTKPSSASRSSSLSNIFVSIRSLASKSERDGQRSAPSATIDSQTPSVPTSPSDDDDVFFDPTSLSLSSTLAPPRRGNPLSSARLNESESSSSQPRTVSKAPTESIRPKSPPKIPPRGKLSTSPAASGISKPSIKSPPPSLLVPKSFIKSAQLTTSTKKIEVPKLPLKSCPSRLNRPVVRTTSISAASKELQEVVASIVEKQHPGVLTDLRSFFSGKPHLFLEARTRLVQSVSESVLTPQLVSECHRKLASDRRAFWESKKKVLASALCSVPLIINSTARQDFLRALNLVQGS